MAKVKLNKNEVLVIETKLQDALNQINDLQSLTKALSFSLDLIDLEDKNSLNRLDMILKNNASFDYLNQKIDKKDLVNISNIINNKINSFTNQIDKAKEEREANIRNMFENKIKKDKEEQESLIANAKAEAANLVWENKKITLAFFEDNQIYNERENEIFFQSSEQDIIDIINKLLPQTDKPFHRNVSKFLWLVKNKQKEGIKFKNANFKFDLLVAQWKQSKGY